MTTQRHHQTGSRIHEVEVHADGRPQRLERTRVCIDLRSRAEIERLIDSKATKHDIAAREIYLRVWVDDVDHQGQSIGDWVEYRSA